MSGPKVLTDAEELQAAQDALRALEAQHNVQPGPVRVVAPASGPITTAAAINADNARCWATAPTERVNRDFQKEKSAADSKRKASQDSERRVREEFAKLKKRPGTRQQAALAIYHQQVEPRLSEDHILKILRKLGLPNK